ncbi:MAG: NUDIX hydrolase [Clostridium sp.]|jgi:hypothetical protein|nr:NUDIX hydrolase [Clostridium sp.]
MDTMINNFRQKLIEARISLSEKLLEDVRKEHDGIYMFFSFDLENSTKFKNTFKDKWSKLILLFYERIKKIFRSKIECEQKKYTHNQMSEINVWKIVGDEILFYKKVEQPQELFYNIKAMFYTMNEFYDEIYEMDSFKEKNKTIIKPNIDIKGSVWIAKCEEKKNGQYNYIYINALTSNQDSNVILGQHQSQIDFLGPDIDEGFRIGKYCSKRKVTVSVNLAYILYELSERDDDIFSDLDKKDISSLFRIVSYEKLKGIWEGRLYPIIFYTHIWDNVDNLFNYEDYLKNDIVKNYEDLKSKEKYNIHYLKKILNDLNLEVDCQDLIKDILDLRNVDPNSKKMYKHGRSTYVNSEVHCVAICFNPEGKVLMLKRSKDRNRMKELWECGCAKINSNETWSTCLKKEYKEKLNIPIEIDEDPIPIATFKITKSGVVVPGIIFKASIEVKIQDIQLNEKKYSEARFMTAEEVENLADDEVVDNLKANIKKAFKVI